MPGLSYQDVVQASAFEELKKKKAWAGMQGGGHFQHATGSNYAKPVLPFDKDKGEVRVKGKRLKPLYRQRGQLCSCIGGCCYCCSQILLSPVHTWWMNHLVIGQAASYCLCNKQKGILYTVTTSACFTLQNQSRSIPIRQLTRAGNNLQKPFTATDVITS